ncbi:MAG: hypothetical protein JSS24_14690 [Proteobacteria bacterium]|nr:hypothetical protein [Pseudomonadota bacterium]
MLHTLGLDLVGRSLLTANPRWAVPLDLSLLAGFGVQHSVMARLSFKRWLRKFMPEALERSTYVGASGVALAVVVACWQPINGVLWQAAGPVRWVLLSAGLFGWLYLLGATFSINHWDLFGLRQAWLAAQGREYRDVSFVEKWMYRYSRHPIQAGVLLGVWSLPTMTKSQAILSAGLTAYIIVGLFFEERDLLRQWGGKYREYKQRVGVFFTL